MTLQEYRNKLWTDFISSEESYDIEHDEAFFKGFDAAIALELPIKFAEWQEQNAIYYWGLFGNIKQKEEPFKMLNGDLCYTIRQLYTYYIENIFKIE